MRYRASATALFLLLSLGCVSAENFRAGFAREAAKPSAQTAVVEDHVCTGDIEGARKYIVLERLGSEGDAEEMISKAKRHILEERAKNPVPLIYANCCVDQSCAAKKTQ